MVKEIKIPMENKAQIAEVREIENKETERGQKPVVESVKKAVLPAVHASDDDEKEEMGKEAAKDVVGLELATADVLVPPLGAMMTGISEGVGRTAQVAGEVTGSQELKEFGEVGTEGAEKPFKDVKKGAEKVGETIKEVFK